MTANVELGRASAPPANTRALTLGVVALLLLVSGPFLVSCLARAARATPIDYNEGWNAYHTARLIAGGPLYRPVDGFPVAPVNYPPLSFLVFGAAARVTGSLLMTGRLLSLACVVCVGCLLFRTVVALTADRLAGALGTLLWLGLACRLAPAEIGSYNEQMLGHVFATGALSLFVKWQAALDRRRIWLLALLCCLGLFVKQLLLAVPVTLAATLLLRNRRRFVEFAVAGLAIAALLALATRLAWGPHALPSLLSFERQMDAAQRAGELWALLAQRGLLVFLVPVLGMLVFLGKEATWLVTYWGVSLALGCYASGGVGIDRNAWLDFFLASALASGTLAGSLHAASPSWPRTWARLALVATILPLVLGPLAEWGAALDLARLEREERAYLADVALLRGVPGPALFEEPLLGFDAGKDLLFDPFLGSQLILAGRLPESLLTDRIRRLEFSAVVLTSRAVEDSRRRLQRSGRKSLGGPPRRVGWWTRGTIQAVRDNYVLHDPGRRRYAFFYFPGRR